MRVGRNEPCSCGSGKKSKNCCSDKAAHKTPTGLLIAIASLVAVAAIGVVPGLIGDRSGNSTPPPVAAGASPASRMQPPGPAPAGQVWSVEHGHFHDIEPASPASSPIKIEQSTAPASTPSTTTQFHVGAPAAEATPPPGAPPPGKVWSAEHGHWHDASQQ
ncbi:MAG TPA: SEC-C metal-binding domain-containing protein [Thermoanaerobaculia bacterium]